jgi:hypothetical protein
MLVGEDVRNWIAELSRHDAVFRVAAVDVISSETAIEAEVLEPSTTVFAAAVSRVQPCDPNAISFSIGGNVGASRVDDADDLVSRNDRAFVRREVAFDSMQVGMAKSADVDTYANFARFGKWRCYVAQN